MLRHSPLALLFYASTNVAFTKNSRISLVLVIFSRSGPLKLLLGNREIGFWPPPLSSWAVLTAVVRVERALGEIIRSVFCVTSQLHPARLEIEKKNAI